MSRFFACAVLAAALLTLGGNVARSGATGASAPGANGRIAYMQAADDPITGVLFTRIDAIDADGGNHASLVGTPDRHALEPSWSPDGTRIAFRYGGEIATMKADGTDIQVLTSIGDAAAPAWSWDGGKIAYIRFRSGTQELWAMNADGSDQHLVYGGPVLEPSWSPGGLITFQNQAFGAGVGIDGGNGEIWTVAPDGSDLQQLTVENDAFPFPVPKLDPTWAPDGSYVLFDAFGTTDTGVPEFGLWKVDADGTNERFVRAGDFNHAVVSPDGTKIVAQCVSGSVSNICVMNADGSGDPTLLTTGGRASLPDWQPVHSSQDVVVTDCNDPRLNQLTSVDGNLVIEVGTCVFNLGTLGSVGGDLTIDGTGATAVNLGALGLVGGNLTITGNDSAADINLGSIEQVGGNLTITDNGPAVVNLGAGGEVGGNLDIASSGGAVNLSGIATGGNLTLTGNGSNLVLGETAGGTTDVTILGGTASVHVVTPAGAFDAPVPFSIERQTGLPATVDGASNTIDLLAGYRFDFGVPTLNADAQLMFTVDVSQLDAATRTALLDGVANGGATIAVRGDAPDAVYQPFRRCAAGETPAVDGCVDVTLLDAGHQPTTDPSDAAFAEFDGVAGHFSDYAVALVTPNDTTPPQIAPVVSGALGDGGYYTSDVSVAWTVEDPDSPIASRAGCDTSTVASDTTGTTFTCRATSAGGSASNSVTIARDATPPTVSYTGNAERYDVDQTVTIGCAANDPSPGSGLASSTCADTSGTAYTFGAGAHTLSATAVDAAGNLGSGSASFTVAVTSGGLCRLTHSFVSSSARYKRLPSLLRSIADASVASICAVVDRIVPRLTPTQKAQLVAAYTRGLGTLVLLGYLTPAQASVLGQLAGSL